MIDEGVVAPEFELPALVDGERRRVALGEHLGEDAVVLAFYPADFNTACEGTSDLDRLDLLTMQGDVTVLGIGPDTLDAHVAFADEYDIRMPLLSDSDRAVAGAYGVTYEDEVGQELIGRAVAVVDREGEVVYAWHAAEPAEPVDLEAVKDALGTVCGDDTALSQYRVGHAHYREGRRAFTSGMGAYADGDRVFAQADLKRARTEFEEAAERFDTAGTFVDADLAREHFLAATEKATALGQAAARLDRSASEHASGADAAGRELRAEAERPLETARALADPIDPDEWPPGEPPVRDRDGIEGPTAGDEDDDGPASLDVDIDATADGAEGILAGDAGEGATDDAADGVGAGAVDDEELAELSAEIAASGPDDPPAETARQAGRGSADAPPTETAEEERDMEAIEADLASRGGGATLEPDPDDDVAGDGGWVDGDAEAAPATLEGIPTEAELARSETAADESSTGDDATREVGAEDRAAREGETGDAATGADG